MKATRSAEVAAADISASDNTSSGVGYRGACYTQLLHAGLECGSFHSQACCGAFRATDRPVCFSERHEDVLTLGSFHRCWACVVRTVVGHRIALEFPDWSVQDGSLGENDRAFNKVLKFSNIAGPAIPPHGVHGLFGNGFDPLVHPARQLLSKVTDKQRHVFDAVTQWRRDDRKDVQAIEQI